MTRRLLSILLAVALAAGAASCRPQPRPPSITLTQAHEKFIRKCKEDYQLDVKLFPVGETLYIYLPITEPLFALKARPQARQEEAVTDGWKMNYLEGAVADGTFRIDYDIAPEKKYPKDPGYSNTYSEEVAKKQRRLFAALQETYGEFTSEVTPKKVVVGRSPTGEWRVDHEPEPRAKVKTFDGKRAADEEMMADFLIIVMADISNGVQMRTIMNFRDFKRAVTDHTFQEEYRRRIISEQPSGDPAIIGDEAGAHLELKDWSWAEFILEQTLHRTKFALQTSSLEASPYPDAEILSAFALCVTAYDFTDYQEIVLHDIAQDSRRVYLREQIDALLEQTDAARRKLIEVYPDFFGR